MTRPPKPPGNTTAEVEKIAAATLGLRKEMFSNDTPRGVSFKVGRADVAGGRAVGDSVMAGGGVKKGGVGIGEVEGGR